MFRIKVSTIYKIFLFFFLFSIVSRGFFELFYEKKTAFLIQVIIILVFIVLNLGVFKVKLDTKYLLIQGTLFLIFLFSVVISIIITINLDNGGAPVFYGGIVCFLSTSFILVSSFNTSKFGRTNIGEMIIVLIIILFSVALYEQITKTLMPGAWWHGSTVRPASLTGSKQHYSIILAILTLFLYQYWLSVRKGKYLIGFLIGVLGVFLSLSRSGSMILALTLLPYICYKMVSIKKVKIKAKLLIWIIAIVILTIIFSFLFFDIGFYFERMISSIDANSPGNNDRIDAWIKGLELIFSSNIIFGEYTGVITNATRTVTDSSSFVVESGILQTILNFGLVGFFSFYFILFDVIGRIKREQLFLTFILISCLTSTMVYQSIETIPFIMLLSIIPIVSDDINQKIQTSSN